MGRSESSSIGMDWIGQQAEAEAVSQTNTMAMNAISRFNYLQQYQMC
jgi:hypothetical protein